MWIIYPDITSGGTYLSTAHGNAATGVNRAAVTGAPYPTAADPYPTGQCGHCHDQHASISGSEPTPPPAEGASSYSVFRTNYGANKNMLCYACHETFNFGIGLGYGRYGVYRGSVIYNNSIHNTDGTMIWPTTLVPPGPLPDTFTDAGNCRNCHNPHGYDDGTANINPIPSMVFSREETLCFECHDGNPAAEDIESQIKFETYRHNVEAYIDEHLAGTQDTFASISANKHVECVDCHNPHIAQSGLHTVGTTENDVSNVIDGVYGAQTTFSGLNWTAPVSYTLAIATKEYEICFKCHSGANTSLTTWDADWTDVGLEVSTGNESRHPVASAIADNLANEQMQGSYWGASGVGKAMYCSDCHAANDVAGGDPEGPHGSANDPILRYGTYPYKSDGTTKWSLVDFSANGRDSPFSLPTGLLCTICHRFLDNNTTFSNNVHDYHIGYYGGLALQDRNNIACVVCHVARPHGSRRARLMALDSDPDPYNLNGNSSWLTKFVQTTRNGYTCDSVQCTTKAGFPGGGGPDPCDSVHP